MSWLRPRRRSVDIACKSKEAEQQHGDAIYVGKEGTYVSVDDDGRDSSKYMNGLLSSEHHADFEKLQQLLCLNDGELVNGDKKGERNSSVDSQEELEGEHSLDVIGGTDVVTSDRKEGANCKNSSETENHAFDKEEKAFKKEEEDFYSDENMNIIKMERYMNKPRHSLDSQLELLPTKKCIQPAVTSLESLSEDGDDAPLYYHQTDTLSVPQKKKSISWASDLETIHEFHRIKGRRLSLTALFKKY